jgi:hypothetical protein
MTEKTVRVFRFKGSWSHAWPWMKTILLEIVAGHRSDIDCVEIVFAQALVESGELKKDFPVVRDALQRLLGPARFLYKVEADTESHAILLKKCVEP